MATKKLLKEKETGLRASKKDAGTKKSSAKGKLVTPIKELKSKNRNKNSSVEKAKPKLAVDKLTKTQPAKAIKKDVVKPVTKKLKAPVKKTSITNTNESKETVPSKKEAAAAKKSKPVTTEEKEVKLAKSPKIFKKEEESNHVVIPKMSTDKKVDYEPDFMKSVLDTPAVSPVKASTRYSDADLQEFKELIGKKLDAAKKELAYLQGLITRRDEMGGDETDNRYMTMEDGGMSMEREQLSQMASRQITFIDHLEKALMRIESKTYGICRVTGKLIDKARLRAGPDATLSIEAKL
jgi:RNA polymerase-binding transcription factor DksA